MPWGSGKLSRSQKASTLSELLVFSSAKFLSDHLKYFRHDILSEDTLQSPTPRELPLRFKRGSHALSRLGAQNRP